MMKNQTVIDMTDTMINSGDTVIMKDKAKFFRAGNVMGAPTITIAGQTVEESENKIIENAYAFSKFIIHKNDQKNKYEMEMLTVDYKARNDGLKFRKISGKTLDEVYGKFNAWMTKNETYLMEKM